MKFCRTALFVVLIMSAHGASASGLRVTCDGEDVGAEVEINGKFKGECPVDIIVPEGTYKLRVFKAVDASQERVFEQVIRMGDGVTKRVEAVLTVRLTAAGKKLEAERSAAEAQREAERLAETAKRESILAVIAAAMVVIPAGSFEMGSHDGDSDEKPVHFVTLRSFALGKTEVTQAQWQAVMGSNPSYISSCGDTCPVEQVSWNDVQEFIQKLNAKTGKQYRLPTESEWEYACRAGGQQQYCGSDSLDNVAWYDGNSGAKTHAVGQKQANAFGLYDMNGNVWEWVEDSDHGSYNGAPTDGSAWTGDGLMRVLRGGSWGFIPRNARAANRDRFHPSYRNYGTGGFRLARTLP